MIFLKPFFFKVDTDESCTLKVDTHETEINKIHTYILIL